MHPTDKVLIKFRHNKINVLFCIQYTIWGIYSRILFQYVQSYVIINIVEMNIFIIIIISE